MTIKEAKEWITEERLDRINHDRERAGEEKASKELLARQIASLDGRDVVVVLSRYE